MPAGRYARKLLALVAIGPAYGLSCAPSGPADLVIATDLTPSACSALVQRISESSTGEPPPHIKWLFVDPGDDPTRLIGGATPVDLILSDQPMETWRGSDRTFRLLVSSISRVERPEVGFAVNREVVEARAMTPPTGWAELADPALVGLIALNDPRDDPATRSLAVARLGAGPWSEGYATLVGLASRAATIGRGSTALAALARGEVVLAVCVQGETGTDAFLPLGAAGPAFAAVQADAPHGERAERFLARLGKPGPPETFSPALRTGLLADLLGSTLVDAQEELRLAGDAIMRLSDVQAEPLRRLLVEAPPWPPASVGRLHEADASGSLVEELATQLAPDLDVRYWLLQSWDEPSQPIDGTLLEKLAAAVDGRLADEPRVRNWLRSEWTAWARQRYRRVLRRAEQADQPEPRS